jgi:hypothetical protein
VLYLTNCSVTSNTIYPCNQLKEVIKKTPRMKSTTTITAKEHVKADFILMDRKTGLLFLVAEVGKSNFTDIYSHKDFKKIVFMMRCKLKEIVIHMAKNACELEDVTKVALYGVLQSGSHSTILVMRPEVALSDSDSTVTLFKYVLVSTRVFDLSAIDDFSCWIIYLMRIREYIDANNAILSKKGTQEYNMLSLSTGTPCKSRALSSNTVDLLIKKIPQVCHVGLPNLDIYYMLNLAFESDLTQLTFKVNNWEWEDISIDGVRVLLGKQPICLVLKDRIEIQMYSEKNPTHIYILAVIKVGDPSSSRKRDDTARCLKVYKLDNERILSELNKFVHQPQERGGSGGDPSSSRKWDDNEQRKGGSKDTSKDTSKDLNGSGSGVEESTDIPDEYDELFVDIQLTPHRVIKSKKDLYMAVCKATHYADLVFVKALNGTVSKDSNHNVMKKLMTIDHPNIYKVFAYYSTGDRTDRYLPVVVNEKKWNSITITKVYTHSLFDYISFIECRIRENKALQMLLICDFLKQVLQGVKKLHEENIIHGDISSTNIVMQRVRVKPYEEISHFEYHIPVIIDCHDSIEGPVGRSRVTTPGCVPSFDIDAQTDIFSVGVILAEIYHKLTVGDWYPLVTILNESKYWVEISKFFQASPPKCMSDLNDLHQCVAEMVRGMMNWKSYCGGVDHFLALTQEFETKIFTHLNNSKSNNMQ